MPADGERKHSPSTTSIWISSPCRLELRLALILCFAALLPVTARQGDALASPFLHIYIPSTFLNVPGDKHWSLRLRVCVSLKISSPHRPCRTQLCSQIPLKRLRRDRYQRGVSLGYH